MTVKRSFYNQGSVETHLRCGRIYKPNNCMIANCPQSVRVKHFENPSIIYEDMDKNKVPRFYGLSCTSHHSLNAYLHYLVVWYKCKKKLTIKTNI